MPWNILFLFGKQLLSYLFSSSILKAFLFLKADTTWTFPVTQIFTPFYFFVKCICFFLIVACLRLTNLTILHVNIQHFSNLEDITLQYSCLENPMDGGAW